MSKTSDYIISSRRRKNKHVKHLSNAIHLKVFTIHREEKKWVCRNHLYTTLMWVHTKALKHPNIKSYSHHPNQANIQVHSM